MATKVGTLSKTMRSPETGETLTRGVRPFKVTYKGKTITVDLPGYYPKGDGDGVHVGNDMSIVDRALRMLKEKVDGIPAPETIRKVRTKLRLSQRRAGALFRVGPNAFDKYERGLSEPDRWADKPIRCGCLCLPQIKREHIGDAVHPGSDGTECVLLPRRNVISARPCSRIGECACRYSIGRKISECGADAPRPGR